MLILSVSLISTSGQIRTPWIRNYKGISLKKTQNVNQTSDQRKQLNKFKQARVRYLQIKQRINAAWKTSYNVYIFLSIFFSLDPIIRCLSFLGKLSLLEWFVLGSRWYLVNWRRSKQLLWFASRLSRGRTAQKRKVYCKLSCCIGVKLMGSFGECINNGW